MIPIDKVQFSKESGFDLECAMELANLISVAYNEYEVWDTNEQLQKDELLPNTITGSKTFINLHTNCLEERASSQDNQVNQDYERLNQFWQQKTAKLETYERLQNLWFPEWWWLDALNLKSVWELLNTNLGSILQSFEDLIRHEQIFGFIACSNTDKNKIFVVFRGTRESAEWINNFRPIQKTFLDDNNLGQVRNGFNLIYTSKRTGVDLDKLLPNPKTNRKIIEKTITEFFSSTAITSQSEIFITGHSLGAGLATLAALHIQKIAEKATRPKSIQLYTFASPRVGDKSFAEHFNSIQSFRVINSEDLIQTVPLPTTQIVDKETLDGMKDKKQARFLSFKNFLQKLTGGQSQKAYQHIGIPITFTKQTDSIAGNHNLTNTYREALDINTNS